MTEFRPFLDQARYDFLRSSGKIDRVAAETIGDGDKSKIDHFKGLMIDAWRQAHDSALEHNEALRSLQSFAGGRTFAATFAQHLSRGGDAASIRGFDEVVDHARRNFPHLVGGIDNAESGVVDLFRKGIQVTPQPWHESVVSQAVQMAPPGFFDKPVQINTPAQDFRKLSMMKTQNAIERIRSVLAEAGETGFTSEEICSKAKLANPTANAALLSMRNAGEVYVVSLNVKRFALASHFPDGPPIEQPVIKPKPKLKKPPKTKSSAEPKANPKAKSIVELSVDQADIVAIATALAVVRNQGLKSKLLTLLQEAVGV